MTKKDYIKIAQAIKDTTKRDTQYLIKDNFIIIICDMFKQDNNLFNKQRFIDACQQIAQHIITYQ